MAPRPRVVQVARRFGVEGAQSYVDGTGEGVKEYAFDTCRRWRPLCYEAPAPTRPPTPQTLPHQCSKTRFTTPCPQASHHEVWGDGLRSHRDLEGLSDWDFLLMECFRLFGQTQHASISASVPEKWARMASGSKQLDAMGIPLQPPSLLIGSAGSSSGAFKVRPVAQQSPRPPGDSTRQAY